MQFVIFHGSFGHPDEHWFPRTKTALIESGQDVLIPAFPCDSWDSITQTGQDAKPMLQGLQSWLNVFGREKNTIILGEKLCFIGHSLGALFVLHVVETYGLQLDSAIFVSPFLEHLGKAWQVDAVNRSFYKTDFDFSTLKKLIPISYVLFSDNDPYVTPDKPIALPISSVVLLYGLPVEDISIIRKMPG